MKDNITPRNNLIIVRMERCCSQNFEDGFESDDEDKVDIMKGQQKKIEQPHSLVLTEDMIRFIPPPREIKQKAYSLHPDMMTGWAPKIPLPKPVPLTFPHDPLAEALASYHRTKPKGITLSYLGPRFDTTYSAWRALGVEFPYNHMGEQRIKMTDRRFYGMSPESMRDGVMFESMFESGNLDAVFKVGQTEYDCFMRVDSNTRGHLQWYYFKVSNLQKGDVYQFNICNFQKAKTLYSRGMKPYLLSYRDLLDKKGGWSQGGEDIQYAKTKSKTQSLLIEKGDEEDKYFTLSFKLQAQYGNDTIQIAYSPPYTFTNLGEYLKNLIGKHKERDIIQTENLCTSLGGFKVPLLTISNSVSSIQSAFKQGKMGKSKGLIFVMGRIHPGEANSSYMMEGFLNWLCGSTHESQQLRNKYLFKVIPMINPDGVVLGNYRTGLSGRDFNREFIDPDRTWFVEVNELKAYLQRCKWVYQKNFEFFLDFHGHTVKKNSFTYGPQFPLTHSKYYQSRLFPKLLSKRTELFRYFSCVFRITPCKSSTARAILLRQYGIPFVYTIEASNGSYLDTETKTGVAFNSEKWQLLGEKTCQALFDYWMIMKQIQESRLKKKKEKHQMKIKSKGAITRRIHSSSYRSQGNSRPGSISKIRLNTESCLQITHKNLFSDIISEITDQASRDNKNSDDQLSEGRSDSENSQDDIDPTQMKTILEGKSREVGRRFKLVSSAHQTRSPITEGRVIKKTSFITECEEDEAEDIRRQPIFDRNKRQTYMRKKMYTTSGSPSPSLREAEPTKTKILNLSFILNPVGMVNPLSGQKKGKTRKQTVDEYEGRQMLRQTSQSYRKNYLSLQKESIRKQLMKKMNMRNNPLLTGNYPFKFQEVVGKKIFSQC